jgi:hypothetical protein
MPEVTLYEADQDKPQPKKAEARPEVKEESLGKEKRTGAKKDAEILFYGQHADEKVLYVVRPHPLGKYLTFGKIAFVAVIIWLAFYMIGSVIPQVEGRVEPIGFWLGLGILLVGVMAVRFSERENVAYITDRRIVRFKSGSLFNVNSRALAWDEAVKVKTYSPNFILRMMNIGSVVVHAKTTIVQMSDVPQSRNFMTDDDVDLSDVHYYRDLGNYIDKVMFLYKRKPEELETLRPFVAKARGKRY